MARPKTKDLKAEVVFKRAFNGFKAGVDWMTPELIKYGKIGSNYVYRLSGGGWHGRKLYSVTVVVYNGNWAMHDINLSKVFSTKISAKVYINNLS